MNKAFFSLKVPTQPEGECRHCSLLLEETMKGVEGVQEVHLKDDKLVFNYVPERVTQQELESRVKASAAAIQGRFRQETWTLTGLDCADCAHKVEMAIKKTDGVVGAALNFASANLTVEYEPTKVGRDKIISVVQSLGYGVGPSPAAATPTVITEFRLTGLDCADCALHLNERLSTLEGVKEAKVNFGAGKLVVHLDPTRLSTDAITRAVEESGYGAVPVGVVEKPTEALPAWRRHIGMLPTAVSGLALILGIALGFLSPIPEISFATYAVAINVVAYAVAILVGGHNIAKRGLATVRTLNLDMNVLMTLAVIGAAAIGEWSEGAAIVFLFSLGSALEAYAMDRARNSIRSLMGLSPDRATVKRNGGEITIPVREIQVGDVIIVHPGERVPIDGRVVAGLSSVDQAPVTGESVPVDKTTGDDVYAGTINQYGALEVEATKLFKDTVLSKITYLVEEAQGQRAPSQRFVDRFSKYYTPTVIGIAVAIAVLPALVFGQPFVPWLYRALVLLVISCPCALVISTPASIVSAIGNAARNGVLVKGGAYLEEMGAISAVVFDKTGTLTWGKPKVTDVVSLNGYTESELLSLAAAVEGRSEHPLAQALLLHAKHNSVSWEAGEDFQALAGRGASARLDGHTYYVGNERLFAELGADVAVATATLARFHDEGKSVMLVGTKEKIVGAVAFADEVRPSAAEAIRGLRAAGVKKIMMITGDNPATTAAVCGILGLDGCHSEALPEDKVRIVKELVAEYGKVAMVGDGVNDAPALAASTVGIAMGAAGTDVALETADIALMSDDLTRLPYVVRLSRETLGTVRQNIIFSLLVKAVFVTAAVPGLVTIWLAVMADMGSSLAVTANGLRLLGMSPKKPKKN